MNLICYLPAELAANHPLRRLIMHGLPQFTRQVYESLTGLERRLGCPGDPEAVLMLVALDRGSLESLVAMGQLCQAHPVILVLPEEPIDLHSLGHRLRPRLMTGLACAAAEVEAVLTRLAGQTRPGFEAARGRQPVSPAGRGVGPTPGLEA